MSSPTERAFADLAHTARQGCRLGLGCLAAAGLLVGGLTLVGGVTYVTKILPTEMAGQSGQIDSGSVEGDSLDEIADLLNNLESTGSTGCEPYKVKNGDTVSGIAATFGSSVGTIAAANGLANPDEIQAGQLLTVPCDAGSSPATTGETSGSGGLSHNVKQGETAFSIARKYGVSLQNLLNTNGLSYLPGTEVVILIPGQALAIPSD